MSSSELKIRLLKTKYDKKKQKKLEVKAKKIPERRAERQVTEKCIHLLLC